MSTTSFKPTLMYEQMVLTARKVLAAFQICNTNIGNELKVKGSKISINTMGAVSAADTSDSTPMTYGDVGFTASDLEIEADKTVAIKLNDTDKVQVAAGGVAIEQAYGNRAIYELNDLIDTLVQTKVSQADVTNYESSTTPWQWGTDASDVPKFFASVNKSMDDAKCPPSGRFIMLPNVAAQGIRLYLGGRLTSLGDQAVQGGFITNLFGIDCIQSPNVYSTGGAYHCLAGNKPSEQDTVPGCIALALQISPLIEKLRLEGYWADGIRVRASYGALVFKPDRAVRVYLNTTLLA